MDDFITMRPCNRTVNGCFRNAVPSVIDQWFPCHIATSWNALNLFAEWRIWEQLATRTTRFDSGMIVMIDVHVQSPLRSSSTRGATFSMYARMFLQTRALS